ncbi:DUF6415 family natural product biosynthesis protein [Streptomyces sp. NPDC001404]|uniref:DUF6415 family natural product biosynthesis protein n=1 Tax=Streptomyces sp. NPDC001404 TaxID=3364571 RepID=UPI00369A066B
MRTLTISHRRRDSTRRSAPRVGPDEYPIDVDDIMGTIRVTLDRLPLAATVDHLLLRLRGHIQLLLPEIEAKNWARYGEEDRVRLVAEFVRDRLNEEPKSGPAAVRCVYAQELACICRDLLALARAEPAAEQPLAVIPRTTCAGADHAQLPGHHRSHSAPVARVPDASAEAPAAVLARRLQRAPQRWRDR